MVLPKEIRDTIYKYVVLSWAPGQEYPLTSPYDEGWFMASDVIAFARSKNKKPKFHYRGTSTIDEESAVMSWRTDGPDDCAASLSLPGEKKGLYDYFKKEEYENIRQFAVALRSFESGELIHTDDVGLFSCNKDLDISNDFLEWFWSNTVMDLKSVSLDYVLYLCYLSFKIDNCCF
jgi:hypothetical protein